MDRTKTLHCHLNLWWSWVRFHLTPQNTRQWVNCRVLFQSCTPSHTIRLKSWWYRLDPMIESTYFGQKMLFLTWQHFSCGSSRLSILSLSWCRITWLYYLCQLRIKYSLLYSTSCHWLNQNGWSTSKRLDWCVGRADITCRFWLHSPPARNEGAIPHNWHYAHGYSMYIQVWLPMYRWF